ncbi:MAG: helix-turn-helix domain-containing protein, partial [Myxococcaceae bacterium]|nr:helix-turn-helix domain-containing protein [Myxococcaceae bacterium]
MLDDRSCYQAVLAKDARFDGVFFVGVSSTGIYCRPVCPARTPARARCRFFRSAAEAEAHGFRACLRCRPERAPGQAPMDAAAALGVQAWRRIEAGALDEGSVEALSRGLGVTSRHLRRVVESAGGASPLALAQSYRLARARALVQDTGLPLVDVAHASGFRSLRRFQAAFRARFDAAPGQLRRGARRSASASARLDYRPPLAWDALLDFLAARAIDGVEAVDGGVYRRTVLLGRHSGWLSVRPRPGRAALELTVSEGLVPVLPEVASRVRRLLDLDARPDVVDRALGGHPSLAPLVRARPGLRVPGAFDGFELAAALLLGSPARAAVLARRLGPAVALAPEPLRYAFPPE